MLTVDFSAKQRIAQCAQVFKARPDLKSSLAQALRYLRDYACWENDDTVDRTKTRCDLFLDFAPLSFSFAMHRKHPETGAYEYWFNGGLILHGYAGNTGDGSAPTFSVSLSNNPGWQIHT